MKSLTSKDEIWAKLDGGTQDYLNRLNGATIPLEKIMGNILLVARQRPVIIQSLFPAINGAPPPAREIKQYAQRLKELKKAGAQIPLVQIYSATRPMARTRMQSSAVEIAFADRKNGSPRGRAAGGSLLSRLRDWRPLDGAECRPGGSGASAAKAPGAVASGQRTSPTSKGG